MISEPCSPSSKRGAGYQINGDPLEDISILTKPEENLALIMKDGKIYKDATKHTRRATAGRGWSCEGHGRGGAVHDGNENEMLPHA